MPSSQSGHDARVRLANSFWGFTCVALGLAMHSFSLAADISPSSPGNLVIIGGGLRPDNAPVFNQLIERAGGKERARFVILPTASSSTRDSFHFRDELGLHGIPIERAVVLDVREPNASTAVHDPENLRQVRTATAVFISGGDQRRLVRLLTRTDGRDTPLLSEIRQLWQRGGVIAGTSAGASCQSAKMLAVSGLPDRLLDEGLDTLDFGLTTDQQQRGLLLTRGFGFFQAGIIDQHFFNFRGRLGRLTRATADSGVPLGFGIDEDTAMFVNSQQQIEVVGRGHVTIVKPGSARGQDGPMGYSIDNVSLTLLSHGDRYDPQQHRTTIDPAKPLLTHDQLEYDGNFLINDMGARGAGEFALVAGLAENTRQSQRGVSVKIHGDYQHGYQFILRKRPTTQAYAGVVNHSWAYSLTDVQLDIQPIAHGMKPAQTQRPLDIPPTASGHAIAAVSFRGIIPPDQNLRFHPERPMTRGEFAAALARTVHLRAPTADSPVQRVTDIDLDSLDGEEMLRTVAAGWLDLDDQMRLRPDDALEPAVAYNALRQVAGQTGYAPDPQLIQQWSQPVPKDTASPTRSQVALWLHSLLQLPQ